MLCKEKIEFDRWTYVFQSKRSHQMLIRLFLLISVENKKLYEFYNYVEIPTES